MATRDGGVLYPARLPEFHRLPPSGAAVDLVGWFWIPEWDIGPGRSSRQHVVGYPALNLVVEGGVESGVGSGIEQAGARRTVTLSGATTRASHRDLRGTGWAVGALLRPAAVAALTHAPADLVDAEVEIGAPELAREVAAAMSSGEGNRERAVAVLSDWLVRRVGEIDASARQANRLVDLLMSEDGADSVEEVAARLAVSMRTLQRVAHRYIGVPPAAMIRRRRLQRAAESLRQDPAIDLADLAASLGYADHAHLTRDFRRTLGIVPRTYRGDVTDAEGVGGPSGVRREDG